MVSWTRADVVLLTAIELEYAAVKRVEAGAAPGSRWIEDKHDGLPVALREFVGTGGRRLRIAVGRAPDMGKGAAVATLVPLVDALRPSCIAMCSRSPARWLGAIASSPPWPPASDVAPKRSSIGW